jgi:hypothetical protein
MNIEIVDENPATYPNDERQQSDSTNLQKLNKIVPNYGGISVGPPHQGRHGNREQRRS